MPHAERKAQLVSVAVRLIGQRGICGTTVSRIATEVGLSEMAVYRHFENKDQIIGEAYLYLLEKWVNWLRCSSDPCVSRRLRAIGEAHLTMLSSDIEMFSAPSLQFVAQTPTEGPLLHFEQMCMDTIDGVLDEILTEGKVRGDIRQDADSQVFAREWVSWARGEDMGYLAAVRQGMRFYREAHLHMLEFIIREVSAPS